MADDPNYEPAAITAGPIDGPSIDDLNAAGPALAQTTTQESLGATATQTWDDLITNRMFRGAQRSDADATPPSDAEQSTWFHGQPAPIFSQPTAPPAPVAADAANAQVKAAGATLTSFTAPVGPSTLQGLIDDNLKAQKTADVINRSAAGIIATPLRFGVGALVSLADPLNDMAMMIPGPGEAFVAARIAEAGGGILARAGMRGAAGAVQGAAGMAALQPLAYLQAQQDHEDYTWGDALRQVAFGAVLGAGGGALHGLLSGVPETTEATIKVSLARVLADDPRGVDVEPIIDQARVVAAQNAAEVARVQAIPALREAEAMRDEAAGILHPREEPAPDPVVQARIEAAQEELTRPGAAPTEARRMELEAEIKSMTEGAQVTPRSELERARDESQRQGLLDAADRTEKAARDAVEKAQQSARDMAQRAMNPTDPELTRTSRINDNTTETAPELEGIADKDHAEVMKMVADKRAEYDMHVANGRIVESPTAGEAGQEELAAGKAKAAYAACGVGL